MDFTALTLGNHEFDNGCEFLNSYINELKTPVLFTNMQTSASCPLKMDHIIKRTKYQQNYFNHPSWLRQRY